MHLRKRPSGRWQATVRLRSGKRCSRTFDRRREAERWGTDVRVADFNGEPVTPFLPLARQVDDAIERILMEAGT